MDPDQDTNEIASTPSDYEEGDASDQNYAPPHNEESDEDEDQYEFEDNVSNLHLLDPTFLTFPRLFQLANLVS